MRYSLNRRVTVTAAVLCFACAAMLAQTPAYKNVGRSPSAEEIHAWDIAISLDGKELPPGSGTAREGTAIYGKKCVACHGPSLGGTPLGPALVGGKGTLSTTHPMRTIGSYWPFATSLWDYINRAMPRNQEGSLGADEVYSLTAFLLYKNEIIKEGDVIDAKTLPKVQMPNRNGFLPQRLEEIHDAKKRGCRFGTCP
jgi:S-disulfanyl-L-cysteine oxidoreductase SoxD